MVVSPFGKLDRRGVRDGDEKRQRTPRSWQNKMGHAAEELICKRNVINSRHLLASQAIESILSAHIPTSVRPTLLFIITIIIILCQLGNKTEAQKD